MYGEKKINIKRAAYIILLFFYLYIPILGGIFTAYVIGMISWLYILFKNAKMAKNALKICALLLISGIYVIVIGLIYFDSIVNTSASIIYLALFSIPSAYMLAKIGKGFGYGLTKMLENVAITATLQGVISIFFRVFDNIRLYMLSFMGWDINSNDLVDILKVRLYGISSGLTYSMPAVQAIIGVLVLIYAIAGHKKGSYILQVPIIWLSGIINARTAIVLIALGILFVILYLVHILDYRIAKRCIVFGLIFAGTAGLALMMINKDTGAWVLDGIQEIFSFFTGGEGGYYFKALTSEEFLKLPDMHGILFGKGIYPPSDVGYVRNVWGGGILMCFLWYGIYIFFMWNIGCYVKKNVNAAISKTIFWYGLAALALLNIKGEICGINEVSNLLILFYVMYRIECASVSVDSYSKRMCDFRGLYGKH